MRAFGMLEILKSMVTYCKIKVLRGLEKYQTDDEKWLPKWIPKVCKMEPLAAQGRPRGDFDTPVVDFEGSRKWVDFEGSLGRNKVDGC